MATRGPASPPKCGSLGRTRKGNWTSLEKGSPDVPRRDIKDSILTSRTLQGLSDGAFRTFIHLLVTVDDYGRFHGDPIVLKNTCFPLEAKLPMVRFANFLRELNVAKNDDGSSLVEFYSVGQRMFCQIPTFIQHQGPPRAKTSKFPAPNSVVENKGDSNCAQMVPDVLVSSSFRSSVSSSKSVSSVNTFSAEPAKPAGLRGEAWPPEMLFVKTFLDTQQLVNLSPDHQQALLNPAFWERTSIACGGIDLALLQTEFAKMGNWLADHKGRQPTPKGFPRFVAGWLERAYEKERRYGVPKQAAFAR